MIVNTARFGEIEAVSDNTWTFVSPILGFEQYKQFISLSEGQGPFEFFQSLEDEHLTFVVTDPFRFYLNYDFSLEQRWLDLLHIEKVEQVVVRSIVAVRSSSDISINLKAPIIMNSKTKEAAQIILDRSEYQTRYLIMNAVGQEAGHADPIEK
ncbi:flagellar assembly protein FliW [Paenibacillus phocaensis]|uniref:flagellar assembly protein FliW n=1 Tax=Paenibacillus phocaensis TaxID=1776378 RepID=UPI000839BD60|nr:flagellar assembly protein FliW [Paenibacillus phocaensis]